MKKMGMSASLKFMMNAGTNIRPKTMSKARVGEVCLQPLGAIKSNEPHRLSHRCSQSYLFQGSNWLNCLGKV